MLACTNEACAGRAFSDQAALDKHTDLVHVDAARKFSTKQRKAAAKSGAAMKDGSFPIQNEQDLKNAIRAVGRASNPAAAKAHIIKRAKALGLTKLLPNDWAALEAPTEAELAYVYESLGVLNWDRVKISCPVDDCSRSFFTEDGLAEHAEAVHTFDDIRRVLDEYIREQYAKASTPSKPGVYTWVNDLAQDWVVWSQDNGKECDLYKASYTLDSDNNVTLGEPAKVVRRTVYDPAPKGD